MDSNIVKQNIKDHYKEQGFKYFVLKIEDLIDALPLIRIMDDTATSYPIDNYDFMSVLDRYNLYRTNQGKKQNSYWVINRDDVPHLDTLDKFFEAVGYKENK